MVFSENCQCKCQKNSLQTPPCYQSSLWWDLVIVNSISTWSSTSLYRRGGVRDGLSLLFPRLPVFQVFPGFWFWPAAKLGQKQNEKKNKKKQRSGKTNRECGWSQTKILCSSWRLEQKKPFWVSLPRHRYGIYMIKMWIEQSWCHLWCEHFGFPNMHRFERDASFTEVGMPRLWICTVVF